MRTVLWYKLPHTALKGDVSYQKVYRPDASKDDEDALYPDIEVWPTVDDLLNGRDPVFETVLQLIK